MELPIRLGPHDGLPPRPKHTRGSKCILGKAWANHKGYAFLPDSVFHPNGVPPARVWPDTPEGQLAKHEYEKYHDYPLRNEHTRRARRESGEHRKSNIASWHKRKHIENPKRNKRYREDKAYREERLRKGREYWARVKDEKNAARRKTYESRQTQARTECA